MKKYELIYCNECRGIGEIGNFKEIDKKSGLEVVEYVVKEREEENECWVNDVGDFVGNKNWREGEDWYLNLVFEGDIEGEVFIVNMCDEFSEVMVIREDSKYFGKFRRDVKENDEGNELLYYEILESLW